MCERTRLEIERRRNVLNKGVEELSSDKLVPRETESTFVNL